MGFRTLFETNFDYAGYGLRSSLRVSEDDSLRVRKAIHSTRKDGSIEHDYARIPEVIDIGTVRHNTASFHDKMSLDKQLQAPEAQRSFNISPVRPCWQAYISEVHPSANRCSPLFPFAFDVSFFGSGRVSPPAAAPPACERWAVVSGGSANVTVAVGDGSGEPGDGDGGSTVTTSTSSRTSPTSLNLTVCLVDFFFTFTGGELAARRVRGSLRGSIYRPGTPTDSETGRTAIHRHDARRGRVYPFRMLMEETPQRNNNYLIALERLVTVARQIVNSALFGPMKYRFDFTTNGRHWSEW
uniref:Uncharacterized protein n=1 Tax=Anopheles farauti TaxID=69004 RepID=A0A182QP69_9DIPT